eukprot:scpid57129/ scgid8937/ 
MEQSNAAGNDSAWRLADLDWHDVELVCDLDASGVCTDAGGSVADVRVAGEFCGWEEQDWIVMQCIVHTASRSSEDDTVRNREGVTSTATDDCCPCEESGSASSQSLCSAACQRFVARFRLLEGMYQYKFIVNGAWKSDKGNCHQAGDQWNSVLFVACDVPNWRLNDGRVPATRHWNSPHLAHTGPGEAFQVGHPSVPARSSARGVLPRPVFVRLPVGYSGTGEAGAGEQRYPVLYVLDGHEAFSTPSHPDDTLGGGWWLDAQSDMLTQDNATCPFIIVGIPSGDFVSQPPLRKREYCPGDMGAVADEAFSDYLLQSVVPFIDGKYRTRAYPKQRVLLGFSMGGLLAFLLGWKAPSIIGKVIAMSPSFWFHDRNNVSAYDVVRSDCERVRATCGMSKEASTGECSDEFNVNSSQDAHECSCLLDQIVLEKTRGSNGGRTDDQLRIYIDSGDGEGDNHYEAACMNSILEESEILRRDQHYVYKVDARAADVPLGVTHCPAVARHRVHHALRLFLPPEQN